MLIVMAGLPGTGTSTLAARLEIEMRAVVLDKDRMRAALFPPRVLDNSAVQDDITMVALYQAVAAIVRVNPQQPVILDGRTFLRAGQVQSLLKVAAALGEPPHVIECVCDDAVARQRLERDLAEARHLAGNRTWRLYLSLKGDAMPITIPHLVLDTGRLSTEECVRRCLDYLEGAVPG